MGLLHVWIVSTPGLYDGESAPRIFLSALSHVGWITSLSCGVGLLLTLATAKAARSAPLLVAFGLYALAWSPFLLRGLRQSGPDSAFGVMIGATLLTILLSVGLARGSLQRARRGSRSPLPWIPPMGLALLLAWLAPWLKPGLPDPDSAAFPSATDLTASQRPTARERFAPGPWNVLLLTVDTLRADHLGMYGYKHDTSPVLDELASRGMRFDHALTIRPKTSPAVASLLTGVYPSRHGLHAPASVLPAEQLTLAERLRERGYRTGASITNGNLFPTFRFDQGFELFAYGSVDAETVSERAIAWLDSVGAGTEPWLLWAHYTDPHTPYDPPEGYRDLFGDPLRSTTRARASVLYDGEIRFTDTQIGRIVAWLDAVPAVRDRTLVVFTADHGESFGEHGEWFDHGINPYEPSARIPLFFVAPGRISARSSTTELASIVDIVPTVLDALGLPIEAEVQGLSLLPLLAGTSDRGPRDHLYLEAGYGEHVGPGRTRALRRKTTKYVQRLVDWARWPRHPLDLLWVLDARTEGGLAGDELYDLETDPHERANLLRRAPKLAAPERARLRSVVEQYGSRDFRRAQLDRASIDEESLRSLRALGYID